MNYNSVITRFLCFFLVYEIDYGGVSSFVTAVKIIPKFIFEFFIGKLIFIYSFQIFISEYLEGVFIIASEMQSSTTFSLGKHSKKKIDYKKS